LKLISSRVDGVTPSVRADRGSVYSGVTPIHTSGITSFPVSVGGDVVANKNVSVTKKVGFVDHVIRYSYDADDVVSVNTGGITSFSAGVDGDGTVGAGTGVSVVNKRIAIVSGDVRVTDGVVSAHAGGDTSVPVRVDESDAVVMNTGWGGACYGC
jgi:hypothetical protein